MKANCLRAYSNRFQSHGCVEIASTTVCSSLPLNTRPIVVGDVPVWSRWFSSPASCCRPSKTNIHNSPTRNIGTIDDRLEADWLVLIMAMLHNRPPLKVPESRRHVFRGGT